MRGERTAQTVIDKAEPGQSLLIGSSRKHARRRCRRSLIAPANSAESISIGVCRASNPWIPMVSNTRGGTMAKSVVPSFAMAGHPLLGLG